MSLISLTCPSCGGKLEVDNSKEEWYCQYCGAKVVHDKQYVELSGNVSIKGLATKDSLLERAYIELGDGHFSEAANLIERVLDADPKCAKAYFCRMLIFIKVKNPNSLSGWPTVLTKYPDYNKALNYSSDAEHEYYESFNKKILSRLNDEWEKIKQNYESTSKAYEASIAAKEKYINDQHSTFIKNSVLRIVFLIAAIIIGLCTLFFILFIVSGATTEGNTASLIFGIIGTAIFGGGAAALTILCIKQFKGRNDYLNKESELAKEKEKYQAIQAEFTKNKELYVKKFM